MSQQFGCDNQTDVFLIDQQGTLQVLWVNGAGAWGGPKAISNGGVAFSGAPVVASQQFGANNQTNVFFFDHNGQLNIFWVQNAGAWNGPVLVGIRPHDLHIKGEAASDGPTFQVIVDISEHTGTEIFATVEIGEAKLIARLPRSPMPQPGQRIDVAFNKERLHLFDVTSKESLLERDATREHVSVGSPEPVAEVQSS